jgi:hypothetical protein
MIEILEVKVENISADKMGQVSRGHIKVRGWLRQSSPPELDDDSESVDVRQVQNWLRQSSPELGDDGEGIDGRQVWKLKTENGSCVVYPDQLPLLADLKWYYLPVLETAEKYSKNKLSRNVFGLVLLETGKENEYRRVGLFFAIGSTSKAFKIPNYPSKALQCQGEEDAGSFSHPVLRAKIDTSKPPAEEHVASAAEMETNRKIPSDNTRKRRLITFFSRKAQDEVSQVLKGQESESGRREWWRFGRQRQPWVEQVITIV